MENLSYVAAVGGSVVSVLLVRWTYRRFDIGGKRLVRGVVAGGAILVGSFVYWSLSYVFVLVQPGHEQQIWAANREASGIAVKIILSATIVSALWLSRPKIVATQRQPEGSVRQRLLNGRAEILQQIENLRSSPVLNYRGGIPQPDFLIQELTKKLTEIDSALATMGPDEA
jgi:hypothetical protein